MDISIIIVVIIGLAVLWPIIVPARDAAVVKAQQLEKIAIQDDLKFDMKSAIRMQKMAEELDGLDEVVTVKELRKRLNNKSSKAQPQAQSALADLAYLNVERVPKREPLSITNNYNLI